MDEATERTVEQAHRVARTAMEAGVEMADRAWEIACGDQRLAGETLEDVLAVAGAFARQEMERRAAGKPRATARQLDRVERSARRQTAEMFAQEVAG